MKKIAAAETVAVLGSVLTLRTEIDELLETEPGIGITNRNVVCALDAITAGTGITNRNVVITDVTISAGTGITKRNVTLELVADVAAIFIRSRI